MKWTLFPKNENLTTSLPITIEIEEWQGKAKVHLESVGELQLRPAGDKLKTEFYVTLPGEYKLTISDSYNTSTHTLQIEQHQYLNFSNEFGIFGLLFLLVMGGIILWTRRIMLKKTP
jgi:hypothetical protein